MSNLINYYRCKNYYHSKNIKVSRETLDLLEIEIENIIKKSILRATKNDRKTVLKQDI